MTYIPVQKNKGYTLLFAVLVSSLVLSVGVSILNISKKELLLTTGARDSSAAFYAADGGLECAVYADNLGTFDPNSDNTADLGDNCRTTPNFHTIPDITGDFQDEHPYPDPGMIFIFDTKFGDQGSSCSVVKVTKSMRNDDVSIKTTIDSKGYNTGWNPSTSRCDVPSVKRLERAMRYSF